MPYDLAMRIIIAAIGAGIGGLFGLCLLKRNGEDPNGKWGLAIIILSATMGLALLTGLADYVAVLSEVWPGQQPVE